MPEPTRVVQIAPGLTAEVYEDGQVIIAGDKTWYLDGIQDPNDPGRDDEELGVLLRPKAVMEAIYGQ